MAWWWRRRGWWRPRRRWRWRRRRRRLPARRARRTVRRPRRRRTVRRRRWGRGRRRRRGFRRRYYTRRRRRWRRKRLVLTQWQPAVRRKCKIIGYLPIVWCGHGRANRNYAFHSDDLTPQPDPYGGALSTVTFSLKVLFDQHTKGLNRWTFPNDQLDLARYKGARFTFYRTKNTDWIAQYDISAPFKLDKYSCPSYHPGMLMQSKSKIIIPSWDTCPKGREKVKVKVQPPKLFIDKWYTQEDLCDVTLVSLAVSAASLTHPFGSPQTANLCTTFQVLRDPYYKAIGFSSTQQKQTEVLDWLYNNHNLWASHLTPGYLTISKVPYPNSTNTGNDNLTNAITAAEIRNWGDTNYDWYPYKIPEKLKLDSLRKQYFEWETSKAPQATSRNGMHHTWTTPTTDSYEYHLGMFSPIFIGPTRAQTKFETAYVDVTYNALLDKGVGNLVWFQYNSKADTQYVKQGCYCVLEDKPLWACFYGYSDFIQSELGPFVDTETTGLICCICPYTKPPMKSKTNPLMGYVFYDTNFGNGKWTDGRGHIETYWQCRWRPEMLFQEQVMRDICETGPFSYKDDYQNSCLVMRYQFNFTWGGNLVSQQDIRNPCKETSDTPGSSRQPRAVQVVDPTSMGPRWVFHSWDWRRGFLSDKAIRRLREKPLDYEEYSQKPKRPRIFPPTEGEEQYQQQGEDSSSEEERWPSSGEEKTQNLQQQLKLQLKRQLKMQQQLQLFREQLLKTQAGLQVNPLLYTQL